MVSDSAAHFPLSPMQQGLLFHGVHASQRGRDIEQVVITLPETPDPAALEAAWALAVERHAILRTAFHWSGTEGPRQEVRTTARIEWKREDWRGLSPEGWLEALETYLAADRERGFRVEEAPLTRLALFQTGRGECRLVWTYHHLLLDARAMGLLLGEVFSSYEALCAGRAPELPAVYPYGAYLDWLQARPALAAKAFWSGNLRGFRAPTPLPAAGGEALSAEAAAALAPGSRQLVLPESFTAEARALARDLGVTLNNLVQGAWALLLGRHGGVDEVVFGAVRACRHLPVEGIAGMVGPTLNTVPLRVPLPPGQAVKDWLRGLREAWVALRPHETIPLADIQGWSELAPGAALFSTLFNFQDPGWDEALQARGGAWAARSFEIRSQPGYPLALDACGGARLRIALLYDRTRFDDATIARLLGHLETLLKGLVSGPERRLEEIPMLKPEERHWLLHGWNDTAAAFPEEATVARMFDQQVSITPAAPAVTAGGTTLSYAELDRLAERLARRILAAGAGRGSLVAVCAERGVAFVAALLAAWKTGAAYVPLDPAHPPARIAGILDEAGCAALLTSRDLAKRIAPGGTAVICLEEDPAAEEMPQVDASLLPAPEDRAYVIYTSGSTGRPKGVAITHHGLANLVMWHRQAYDVTAADRATQLASPAFDAAGWEIWPYLAAGASVHVPDEETRLSPARLVRWLHEQAITLCFLPTPLAEAALAETWPRTTSLRAVLTGGDRLLRRPGPDFPSVLVNHYGPTECTVVATFGEVAPAGPRRGTPSIGRPIANTRVHVLDRSFQPVPLGAAGELFIGGVGLAEGYLNQPGLTAEKFIADPFDSTPGARLYRTGDQVRRLEDGSLDFIGRIDDQVKIRGQRIEPGEIEAVLAEHPALAQAAVVAQELPGGTGLVAFCVAANPPPDAGELRAFLQRRLPDAMIPAAFVLRDELPLTSNGKIDRRLLAAMDAGAAALRPAGTPPETPAELALARIWRELLARPQVDREDSFFELGGHSLLAMQLIARVRAQFGVELPLPVLFERPTLAGLAAEIGGAKPARSGLAARIRRRNRPLSAVPNEV